MVNNDCSTKKLKYNIFQAPQVKPFFYPVDSGVVGPVIDPGFVFNSEYGDLVISIDDAEKHPMAKKVTMPDGSDGMNCVDCNEYFPYAGSNQENGTLICYTCRNR